MLNHIDLAGRLVSDPVLRYTQSNKPVVSFRIACDRDFGPREEHQTDFINCVAWEKTAEFVSRYFKKGEGIILSGRLQIRTYETEDGKQSVAEVKADRVYFAGGGKKTETSISPTTFTDIEDFDGEDGELPF